MATTRMPSGVTNVEKTSTTGSMGQLDPTKFHTFFDDFDTYDATQWVITTTEAGAGAATEALADEDGGVLLITNDDANNDRDFFQKVGESFLMQQGKKAWFKSRIKMSDVINSYLIMGLQITDDSPLGVSDGMFFIKQTASANLDFIVGKDSVNSQASTVTALADDTWVILGFAYNGSDKVEVFIDDVKVDTLSTENLPDDELLTISFGVQNGEAASKSLSVDYIMMCKER